MKEKLISIFPLFICLYICFLMPIWFEPGKTYHWPSFVVLILFQPFLPALLISLIASYSKWIKWIIISICFGLFFAELFCFFNQGSRLNSSMAIIAFQTNLGETKEFLSISSVWRDLAKSLFAFSFLIAIYICLCKISRSGLGNRIGELLTSSKTKQIFLGVSVGCLSLVSIGDIAYLSKYKFFTYWKRINGLHKATTPLLYPSLVSRPL